MRFVSVRDLRSRPTAVWGALASEDVVVTSSGRPIGVLVRVEGGDLEATLASIRQARAQAAVRRMREAAARSGLDSLDAAAIDAEVRAARAARRRPSR